MDAISEKGNTKIFPNHKLSGFLALVHHQEFPIISFNIKINFCKEVFSKTVNGFII